MGHTSEWIRESLRSAFLTSTEEMLKLLLDPYLENYCSEGSKTEAEGPHRRLSISSGGLGG